jgi:hypothetical protein
MGHKWVPACKTPTPTERSNALAPSTHAAVALWVAHNHCHTIMMPMGATTVARCLCGYMHCSMERRPAACRRVCAARGSTTSGWHQPCHLRARCMCVGSKLPVAAGPGEGSTGSITTAMVPTYVSQAHVLAAAAAHHWAVGCSLPPPPPPGGGPGVLGGGGGGCCSRRGGNTVGGAELWTIHHDAAASTGRTASLWHGHP